MDEDNPEQIQGAVALAQMPSTFPTNDQLLLLLNELREREGRPPIDELTYIFASAI